MRRDHAPRRPAPQVLALPKGRPDDGETPAEAALREVREETGVDGARREHARRRALLVPARRPADRARSSASSCSSYVAGDPTTTTTRSRRRAGCRSSEAREALTYKGEREMVERALSQVAPAGR